MLPLLSPHAPVLMVSSGVGDLSVVPTGGFFRDGQPIDG